MEGLSEIQIATQTVGIPAGVLLGGDLVIPPDARAIVVFAHGSDNRSNLCNQRVARRLHSMGLATLLFDLLTIDEESLDAQTGHLRFDVPLFAERLAQVTDWLGLQAATRALQVGYFGAGTGAAAALVAAAVRPGAVRAVVSRGGRPDLAGPYLGRVKAPTLLIVGGANTDVVGMNWLALRQLGSPVKRLETILGATHLLEEPDALERVSELAVDWFAHHLAAIWQPASDVESAIC
jgi:dienelactone hydrolase